MHGLIVELRWWRNLELLQVLTFTRDRVVESFLWAVGVAYEPQYSSLRTWLTKAIVLVLIIDDVYDIYASDHELDHFTTAVERYVNQTSNSPRMYILFTPSFLLLLFFPSISILCARPKIKTSHNIKILKYHLNLKNNNLVLLYFIFSLLQITQNTFTFHFFSTLYSYKNIFS